MQSIVLVGDSIRMHYQDVVIRELAGKAEVWAPVENGENSAKVLRYIDEWVVSRNPDIVQINCGLHDLKRKCGAEHTAVPIEQYEANVREILERVVARTDSLVIWASTTPVNETWHRQHKGFDRWESDVLAFNAVAEKIARPLGVMLNDLYTVVMEAGRDRYLRPDGVHFTEEGSVLLGQAVAAFLQTVL